MGRYLVGAWTRESRCYGMVAADLGDTKPPPRADTLLSLRQIKAVVAYVQATYQGKEMTLEACIRYFSPTWPGCDVYR